MRIFPNGYDLAGSKKQRRSNRHTWSITGNVLPSQPGPVAARGWP